MKGSSILLVVGGGITIGLVAYCVYKTVMQPSNTDASFEQASMPPTNSYISPNTPPTISPSAADMYEAKGHLVMSVCERHQNVHQAIDDLLDDISTDEQNTDNIVTPSSTKLNQIRNDLDDLLK